MLLKPADFSRLRLLSKPDKAPTAPDSGKPDEKDAKPAAALAPADEEAKPATRTGRRNAR